MPCATSSQASALREEITTFAPTLASNSAEERPMPRPRPGYGGEVIFLYAKGVFDYGRAFEGVPDLGLQGHADAAMKLNRLLADEFAGLADLPLGGGDRRGALLRILEIAGHGRKHRHRA